MGRYDILLEQDNNSKEPQTPAVMSPRPDAPQQGSPPSTLTESPTPSPSTPRSLPVPRQPLERTPERPNGRTPTRTPERSPQRRIITRNSFEIYEDQMESLRKLAYREKMEGGVGSMSRMVRDAIDHYLTTTTPSDDEPERPHD